MVFVDEKIKELISNTKILWALGHAMSLMSWDAETYMPKKGVIERSVAMGELSVLSQKLLLDDKIVKSVERLAENEGLNDYEKGVVRVLKREIKIMSALPPDLVREIAETTQRARPIWRGAKEKNDFGKFEPILDKIISLIRKAADYIGYEVHPYDALLDRFEEGLLTRDVDYMFNTIEPKIRDVLNKIMAEEVFPQNHPLEKQKYDVDSMREVNKIVLEKFGYSFDRGRLDESAHPFTIHMGLDDVRITTRYEGFDFKRALFSTVHEFGHALYELQIDPNLRMTPIGTGVSLGIHESQSRFWENIIGRSLFFTEGVYNILKEHLHFIKDYSEDEVFKYFNIVRPSLIRTEADEVTYNFHILLRFRLEKLMIEGQIKANDLPELWNSEMDRLLGIKPKTYSHGVLQDIHWSLGSIGYFPTYSIGTLVAAQIRHHIVMELSSFNEDIRNLKFDNIKGYLKAKVHKYGSAYPPKELLRKSFGEELQPNYFIRYIESKYLI